MISTIDQLTENSLVEPIFFSTVLKNHFIKIHYDSTYNISCTHVYKVQNKLCIYIYIYIKGHLA